MRMPKPLIVVAIALALPVFTPFAIVHYVLDTHRMRNAARSAACPSCGRTLGIGALQVADERWRAHVAELRRTQPGVRFRLVRLVHAICVACGVRLSFRSEAGIFIPTDSEF